MKFVWNERKTKKIDLTRGVLSISLHEGRFRVHVNDDRLATFSTEEEAVKFIDDITLSEIDKTMLLIMPMFIEALTGIGKKSYDN